MINFGLLIGAILGGWALFTLIKYLRTAKDTKDLLIRLIRASIVGAAILVVGYFIWLFLYVNS